MESSGTTKTGWRKQEHFHSQLCMKKGTEVMGTKDEGPAYKGMLPSCSVPTVPACRGSSDLGWLWLVRSRFSNLCPKRSVACLNMSDQVFPSMDFFLP